MIFLNYRRDDTPGYTRLIYNSLIAIYGQENVFFDVDIQFGVDFVNKINATLERTDVLVAVLGRRWLTITDDLFPRRVDNPEDYVRIEIEAAIDNKVSLLPVTVEGAKMPHARDVPETLKSFVRINALDISHERYPSDIERLRKAIDQQISERKEKELQRKQLEEAENRQNKIQEELAEAARLGDKDRSAEQPHVAIPNSATRLIYVGQLPAHSRYRARRGMKPRILSANYRLKYEYSPPKFALIMLIVICLLIVVTFIINNQQP